MLLFIYIFPPSLFYKFNFFLIHFVYNTISPDDGKTFLTQHRTNGVLNNSNKSTITKDYYEGATRGHQSMQLRKKRRRRRELLISAAEESRPRITYNIQRLRYNYKVLMDGLKARHRATDLRIPPLITIKNNLRRFGALEKQLFH